MPASSRVVSVEVRRLALPTGIEPVRLGNGQLSATDLPVVLIRLVDDDGAHGFSLLWAQQAPQLALFEAALDYLAPLVAGHRLDETPGIVPSLRASTPFIGPEGVLAFAVSAYEMAIEDLWCRRAEVSLGHRLGRTRDRLPAYQTGLMLASTTEALVIEARKIYDSGIKAIKMIVGKPSLSEDLDRIDAVKSSLPGDVRLMVDAFQKWNVTEAQQAAERFAAFDLLWIEDPLAHADLAGYRRLAAASPVPIATGEGLFRHADFVELADAGVPYLVGELERIGGISGWVRLADTAESSGVTLLPHINPHVSAQLVAALAQKSVWWEYIPWFDALAGSEFRLEDGALVVEDRPGCGFSPDADAVERLAAGPWRALGKS